jgi:hypothetical protein
MPSGRSYYALISMTIRAFELENPPGVRSELE